MKINYPDLKQLSKKIIIFLLCVSIGWYLKGRLSPSAGMAGFGQGETYVLVQKSKLQDVTSVDNKISYVEAINEADILPKVTGTIEKVLFKEGSVVNQGDILFEIDSAKYKAAYDLSKARLDSAKANLVKAERDYNRQVKLSDEKFASKATFDLSESVYLQAKAAVEEAEANLNIAKLDLDYTKVRAPISGKIGKALVSLGNYVVASSKPLAKIVQINPMRITFSLTDKEAAMVRKAKYSTDEISARITMPTGDVINEKIVNAFFDNMVNPSTATVSVYIDVANENDLLVQGGYVQTAVITGKPVYAVVINQAAINYDKNGAFVYVAKIDEQKSSAYELHGTAEQRRVVLGDVAGETGQVVSSGLSEDEMVVVQGNVKIQNGSAIKIGMVE